MITEFVLPLTNWLLNYSFRQLVNKKIYRFAHYNKKYQGVALGSYKSVSIQTVTWPTHILDAIRSTEDVNVWN